MSSRATELPRPYYNRGLIIDSNLLLLFFVGLHDPTWIDRFKRTSKFSSEDFARLVAFMDRFKEIVTTPSILTEVSNLLGQLPEKLKYSFRLHFARGLKNLNEQYTSSRELGDAPIFAKFGLTDTAILLAARGKYVVLTDDFPLAQYLETQKIDVINFNHLRKLD
jgi:rRNA-processing protein FCF1